MSTLAGERFRREASTKPRRIMHITDNLELAGKQRVAVNLANRLGAPDCQSYLCTTRSQGPLSAHVQSHVQRLDLGRRTALDVISIARLRRFVRARGIDIVHAHGPSLFLASLSCRGAGPRILWHDHYGRHESSRRAAWLYRLACKSAHGVISCTPALAQWTRQQLGVPEERVWYVPNSVIRPASVGTAPQLPGEPRSRVVCVARLEPQKDQRTLVRAMSGVASRRPEAHLLLVGDDTTEYARVTRREISRRGLEQHVSLLGQREDVPEILSVCAIGVLSSASEAFPLALLEYGVAGLPAVATRVGQCAEILDGGHCGRLVAPGSANPLGRELLRLLASPDRGRRLGKALRDRIATHYSAAAMEERVKRIYDTVLGDGVPAQAR